MNKQRRSHAIKISWHFEFSAFACSFKWKSCIQSCATQERACKAHQESSALCSVNSEREKIRLKLSCVQNRKTLKYK